MKNPWKQPFFADFSSLLPSLSLLALFSTSLCTQRRNIAFVFCNSWFIPHCLSCMWVIPIWRQLGFRRLLSFGCMIDTSTQNHLRFSLHWTPTTDQRNMSILVPDNIHEQHNSKEVERQWPCVGLSTSATKYIDTIHYFR